MFIRWTNPQQHTHGQQQSGFKPWWLFAGAGAGLIGSGLLIMLFPQILVAFISSMIMMAGFYLLSIGISMKSKSESFFSGNTESQKGDQYTHKVTVEVPRGDSRFNHHFNG
jgi:hypothetical protein